MFANAQTGNLVLLGVDAGAQHWRAALLHVPPIAAFFLGVAVAEWLSRPAARRIVKRPTRLALSAEVVVLSVVGLVPGQVPGQIVTAAVAFAAAVQVSTFRSLEGIAYSTTLTTTNLRSLVEKTYQWRADRDTVAGQQAAKLGSVVVAFAAGAGIGGWCTHVLGPRAAWLAAAGLLVVLTWIIAETMALSRRRPGDGPDGTEGS